MSSSRSTQPYRNDELSCYFRQHADPTQPSPSTSGASYVGPEDKRSARDRVAASEMNGSQHGELPDLPDLTNCSFEEIVDVLRQMGGITEDGIIKVGAENLIEKLGEEDARRLVAFFNKESPSMDLVITEGVWGFDRDQPETDAHKQIPEWCMGFLRKLVVGLSTTYATMLVDWKEGCEGACGILTETISDINASEQRANETHAAAIDDIRHDLRRAKAAHEEMLRTLPPINVVQTEARQGKCEGEENRRNDDRNSTLTAVKDDDDMKEYWRREKAAHEERLRKLEPISLLQTEAEQGKHEGELYRGDEYPNIKVTSKLQEGFEEDFIDGFIRVISDTEPKITGDELEVLSQYMKSVGATSEALLHKVNERVLGDLIGTDKAKRIMRRCKAKTQRASSQKDTVADLIQYVANALPNITEDELEELYKYMKSVGATSEALLHHVDEGVLGKLVGAGNAKLIMRLCQSKMSSKDPNVYNCAIQ